ncbi:MULTISPECIES: hypothetical protein [Spirulina sp. CCY15215]|uniref:hypothetical protein n=1 Tax=Spirulina sp. CCY15215 TaxID=2767591 RepID=UPI00194F060D|nr:hypothetical protein [Spirulina major]
MFSESQQVIQDFWTLLEREKGDRGSSLFGEEEWQSLAELEQELAKLGDVSDGEIAKKIIDWCEKYPAIETSFNNENWPEVRINIGKKNQVIPQIPEGERPIITDNQALIMAGLQKELEKRKK